MALYSTRSVPRGSNLKKLFNWRPDLGDLLVSCRNTNEVVPYIDLVNEVLESALRYLQTNNNKLEKRGMRIPAHNADDVEKDTQDSSDYDSAYNPWGLLSTPHWILKTDFICNCLDISVASQSNTARKASGNIATQLEGFRICGKNEEDAGTYELQRLEHFVRIWRRLGWSVEDTDDALMVFGELPPPDSDLASNAPQGGLVITPSTIKSLVAVRRISDLFVSRALRQGATAVAASNCVLLFLATVGMSQDDFVQIQDDEGLGDDLSPNTLWVQNRDMTAANMAGVPYSDLLSLLATLSTEVTPLSTPEAWLKTL
ncbi:hypothetical protein K4K53_000268 [Colletotrichum sp. SAR 10_77]|nr:hypothetical protein K4K53_000268 [Colletotrichum sp. SAR 10_77]